MLEKEMIMLIQVLPEICRLQVSTEHQKLFLYMIQTEWEWTGKQLDFLMKKQIGYRPVDPLDYFYSWLFQGAEEEIVTAVKKKVQLKSNYLFAIFLVINEHWDTIRYQANHLDKTFSFIDPRCFFLEICKEMAQLEIADAFNLPSNSPSGASITSVRKDVATAGKILRGTHPDQPNETEKLLTSRFWIDFAFGAIIKQSKYLKTSDTWKKLLKAQKERERWNRGNLAGLLWLEGIPVNAQNKKRLSLS